MSFIAKYLNFLINLVFGLYLAAVGVTLYGSYSGNWQGTFLVAVMLFCVGSMIRFFLVLLVNSLDSVFRATAKPTKE